MRDDGRKALEIPRQHYQGKGKPRDLWSTTSCVQRNRLPEYRAEEVIRDALLIAKVLKGLRSEYNTFARVITFMGYKPYNFYAFPPFSLVPRCLQKIQQDQATGILIVPLWPTQAWFHLALQMFCNQPWILPPRETSLQDPATTPTSQETPPTGVSCLRRSFERYNLSTEVVDFIMESWRKGTKKQYSTYINQWVEFCNHRQISHNSPEMKDTLQFLMMLVNKGLSYSTVNTARSALSNITEGEFVNFGTHPVDL